MIDRKKVCKGLYAHGYKDCKSCPYWGSGPRLEALSGLFPALPEICMLNTTFFVAIPLNNYRGHFDNKYYGKTWRCWTARPTDEQREAAKWNET